MNMPVKETQSYQQLYTFNSNFYNISNIIIIVGLCRGIELCVNRSTRQQVNVAIKIPQLAMSTLQLF